METPIWEKRGQYADKEEETKHRNQAAVSYVEQMRPLLAGAIEREMEEDRKMVTYALRNYSEMFWKQRSEHEWNPRK